jgi:type I restriction enzyme S subunit
MKNISQEKVLGISTIRPPLPLQQDFARRLAAVEKLKVTHRASLASLDALFASLSAPRLPGRAVAVAFEPRFTISNAIAAGLTTIERARGFFRRRRSRTTGCAA